MNASLLLHATAVEIDGRAVLLRGPSGSGKSDLGLRLIDAGARLVADDQSELSRHGDVLMVRAPPREAKNTPAVAGTWVSRRRPAHLRLAR